MGDSNPSPPPSDIEEPNKSATSGSHTEIREQDRLLPIANVGRIMRKILPSNANISKEAKETMQECVSEFISFVTGEASEKCEKEKRKTINGDDILWAMNALGFEAYAEPLKAYLQKYRDTVGEKLSVTRQGLLDNSISGANHNNNNMRISVADQPQQHHQHYQHHGRLVIGTVAQNQGRNLITQPLKMHGAGPSTDPSASGSHGRG